MQIMGIVDLDSYHPGRGAQILQTREDAAARDFDLPTEAARGRDRGLRFGSFDPLGCVQEYCVSVESDL